MVQFLSPMGYNFCVSTNGHWLLYVKIIFSDKVGVIYYDLSFYNFPKDDVGLEDDF